VAREHRRLEHGSDGADIQLGPTPWRPGEEALELATALRRSLDRSGIVDLILFGSQARGSTTGFSDVDALLVIDDETAEDPNALRALREHVIAAQRAVVSHQPMQHHAFELATPRLLTSASQSLRMPAVVFAETRSLMGRGAEASFEPDSRDEARPRLSELVSATRLVRAWPRHPWVLHQAVSMFELLPALYLQALGQAVEKWQSFGLAGDHFGDDWWPYGLLEQVRAGWVRSSPQMLLATASVLRNPWLAIAVWRRLPARRRQAAGQLLTDESLAALRALAERMRERAC
jgi:hypothetical protein